MILTVKQICQTSKAKYAFFGTGFLNGITTSLNDLCPTDFSGVQRSCGSLLPEKESEKFKATVVLSSYHKLPVNSLFASYLHCKPSLPLTIQRILPRYRCSFLTASCKNCTGLFNTESVHICSIPKRIQDSTRSTVPSSKSLKLITSSLHHFKSSRQPLVHRSPRSCPCQPLEIDAAVPGYVGITRDS